MKYALVNRNTGKTSRKAATREEARWIKRMNGFKHDIVRLSDGSVVR